MRSGHLSCRQGKRVLVHLRDGTKLYATFKQKRSTVVEFYDHDPIPTRLIRTIGLAKGKSP